MNALNYDVVRSAWIADFLDPINYHECFVTGGGNNRTGWSSPDFDELVEQARHTVDHNTRYNLLQQAEAILLSEAPVGPIYTYKQKFLVSPEVQWPGANPLGYLNYRYFSLADAIS
jgi:oligopeptide transport system substrate-binding protein